MQNAMGANFISRSMRWGTGDELLSVREYFGDRKTGALMLASKAHMAKVKAAELKGAKAKETCREYRAKAVVPREGRYYQRWYKGTLPVNVTHIAASARKPVRPSS